VTPVEGEVNNGKPLGKFLCKRPSLLSPPPVLHEDHFEALAGIALMGEGMEDAVQQVESAVEIDDAGNFDPVPRRRDHAISPEFKG
jgi:hypothetical protein